MYRNNFTSPNKRLNAGTLIVVNNNVARSSYIKHSILIPGYLQMLDVTPKDPSFPPYRILNFYGQQTVEDRLAQIGCIESLTPTRLLSLGETSISKIGPTRPPAGTKNSRQFPDRVEPHPGQARAFPDPLRCAFLQSQCPPHLPTGPVLLLLP